MNGTHIQVIHVDDGNTLRSDGHVHIFAGVQ